MVNTRPMEWLKIFSYYNARKIFVKLNLSCRIMPYRSGGISRLRAGFDPATRGVGGYGMLEQWKNVKGTGNSIFHHSTIPMVHPFPNRSPIFKSIDRTNSIAPIFSPFSTQSLPIFMIPPRTAIWISTLSKEMISPGLFSIGKDCISAS